MSTKTPALCRSALSLCAAAALSGSALFVAVPGAYADAGRPSPPEQMSAIGGERLARPGTQVEYADGVPSLPPTTARAWIIADAETGEVVETLDMPEGTAVSGLESDGAGRFFCGGGSSGKVRAVRLPK